MRLKDWCLIGILALAVGSLPLWAAGPVIGLAVSDGPMVVDRAAAAGNVNLREGAEVRTGAAGARIQLARGVRAALAPESAARVYRDRLELLSGAGSASGPGYGLEAGGFVIETGRGAQAQVYRRGAAVEVAAVRGPVAVKDSDGALVARVEEGTAVRVEPDEQQSGPGGGAPGGGQAPRKAGLKVGMIAALGGVGAALAAFAAHDSGSQPLSR